MGLKDLKERLADAVETENPTGTGYYGAEVDEAEVEADRERIEKATQTGEEANRDSGTAITIPVTRRQAP